MVLETDSAKKEINISMPADFNNSSIIDLHNSSQATNNLGYTVKVSDVYGALQPSRNFPTARNRISPSCPDVSAPTLTHYIKNLHKNGIRFNYLLNGIIPPEDSLRPSFLLKAIKHVEELCKIGVDVVTVANPILIDAVKTNFPELKVNVSVVANIDSLNKVHWMLNKGVDSIALPETINREFGFLRNVSKLPCKFTLQLNAKCSLSCPIKQDHYQYLSTHPEDGENLFGDYFTSSCGGYRSKKKWDVLKSAFIRPEDIPSYFKAGINSFKFVGREWQDETNNLKALNSYRDMNFQGNIFELLNGFRQTACDMQNINNKELDNFLQFFLDKNFSCRDSCEVACQYCKTFFKNLTRESDNVERAF